ncbi:tannase/feruloyl esterase family alpha/beta hydrolase [Sphingobium sp.]|uniref:tannase/feruloyl esterase family alpha/beta hydrolase n=1 Tax=Sphingobium sp. TaxID=1912891 RepID=UPI00260B92FA|nr:tannase/feruloyl esterase family alpha/beta hydrolase [Sphingobium sp.]
MHRRHLSSLAAIASAGLFVTTPAAASECDALIGSRFGEALVYEVNDVRDTLHIANIGHRTPLTLDKPLCRVKGLIEPVSGSQIQFELWLPPKATWNGRYAGVGNGAFSGSIMFDEMMPPFQRGYAVSSTDAGHVSTGSQSGWALHQPERVTDWAWRAHHLTAIAAKQIVTAYYGIAAKHSYFLGCSKGGTSAMMEAQRFPDDYDGILVGAPGWDQSGQITSYLWTQQAVSAPGGWLSAGKLRLLNQAVLKSCGGMNGYLSDPARCTFDPGRLQCKGADGDDCLTAQQVGTVRKIYSGPTDAAGKSLYPGLARGSELNWERFLMGPADRPATGAWIYANMLGYMGNVLYGQTDIDFRALDPASVWSHSRRDLGRTVDAVDYDLTKFAARGGKMIHFHGWNDPIVRPAASPLYFDRVAANMGGVERTLSFYRLFMGPGMDHCSGGIGPNAAGGPHNDPAASQDPEHDMLAALERWVEQGQAPQQIIATRYRDNDPAKGIEAQRPWCPYPAIARYRGKGDPTLAVNYSCQNNGKAGSRR